MKIKSKVMYLKLVKTLDETLYSSTLSAYPIFYFFVGSHHLKGKMLQIIK